MNKRSFSSDSSGSDSSDDADNDLSLKFLAAVRSNNFNAVKEVLRDNQLQTLRLLNVPDLNAKSNTALHIALQNLSKSKPSESVNIKEIIKILLHNNADINCKNSDGKTPFDLLKRQIKKHPTRPDLQEVSMLFDNVKTITKTSLSPNTQNVSSLSVINNKKTKKGYATSTYAASGLKTSLHGTIYQLQLLMFYLHRVIDKFSFFDLATEMDQADKFDDIVFRFKSSSDEKWHWSFLQAKHKNDIEQDKITLQDFILKSDGVFSVTKYFISFCKIKVNPAFENDDQLNDFLLCTNTSLDLSLRMKTKKDGNLTPDALKHNEFVNKWIQHFTTNSIPDDSPLFVNVPDGEDLKPIVYTFNDSAFHEIAKIIGDYFLEISEEMNIICLTFIKDKFSKVKITNHKVSANDVFSKIKKLHVDAKEITKENYITAAGNLLTLAKSLMNTESIKPLQDKLGTFKKTSAKGKEKSSAQYRDALLNLYTSMKDVEKTLNDILLNAESKLRSFNTKNTAENTGLQQDVDKLLKMKQKALTIRANILKSDNEVMLKSILQEPSEIVISEKLKQLGNKSDWEESKQKAIDILEKFITEIVIIELSLNEDKFNLYLKEFLLKFKLITQYLNVNQLNRLLKMEFQNKFSFLESDLITDSFERQMLKWLMEYKQGRAPFLSQKIGQTFFADLNNRIESFMVAGLTKAYLEELYCYNISFIDVKDDIDEFLSSQSAILHISTETTKLVTINVLEKLKKSKRYAYRDSYICVRFSTLRRRSMSQLILNRLNNVCSSFLLIIDCHNDELVDQQFEVTCEDILSNFSLNLNMKIVFISSKVALSLYSNQYKIKNISFKVKFQQLTRETQNAILSKKIRFQNKNVCLNKLIDVTSAEMIFNDSFLQTFVEETKIEIGDSKAFSFIGFIPENYIQRCLQPQKLITDVFKLENAIFLISGSVDFNLIRALDVDNDIFQLEDKQNICPGNIVIVTPSDAHRAYKTLKSNYNFLHIIWIGFWQNQLFWKDCSKNFSEVEKCVDKIASHESTELSNEHDFVGFETGPKVVIIANDPGVGKSTFITSLSQKMKENNNSLWIVRINLTDHAFDRQKLNELDNRKFTRSLNDIPNIIDVSFATEFISDMVIWTNKENNFVSFERKLFNLSIQGDSQTLTPKVVIFFDGFDEISPTFREKTIKLLKSLSLTGIAKMWITTRIQEKNFLQDQLGYPAYVLTNLNRRDQIAFMNRYWREKVLSKVSHLKVTKQFEKIPEYLRAIMLETKQNIDNEDLENHLDFCLFATDLLKIWDYAIKDSQTAFGNIPLQLKMLAEVIFDNHFKLPEEIGLINLYNSFVQNKFDIYFYGKNVLVGNVPSEEVRRVDSNSLCKDYSLLALKLFFPTYLWPETERSVIVLARAGLVIAVSEYEAHFIHRSFAEYFLADFFVKNLNWKWVQTLLLKEILIAEDYVLIKTFFNEFLVNNLPGKDVKLCESLLEEIISSSYKDTFLHIILRTSHVNIIQYFVEKLYDYKRLLDQLLCKPGQIGSAPFYSLIYNPLKGLDVTTKIHNAECFMNALHDEHIIKILTHTYDETNITIHVKITALQISLLNELPVFKFLLFYLKRRGLLKEVILNNGYNGDGSLFHFCCRIGCRKLIDLLDMVANSEESNFVELKPILLVKDSLQRTVLHWLAFLGYSEVIVRFFDWLQLHMYDNVEEFLQFKDKYQLTALLIAVHQDKSDVVKVFLTFLRDNLSQQFDCLFSQFSNSCIIYNAIFFARAATVDTLFHFFKNSFPTRILDRLGAPVTETDSRTLFCLAAARNHAIIIQFVFDWLEANFSAHDYNFHSLQLLEQFGKDETSPLHEAIRFHSAAAVQVLINFINNKLDLNAQLNFLFATTKKGEFLLDHVSTDEIKEMLNESYNFVITKIRSMSNDLASLSCNFTLQTLNSVEIFLNRYYQGSDKDFLLQLLLRIKCFLNVDQQHLNVFANEQTILLLPPG